MQTHAPAMASPRISSTTLATAAGGRAAYAARQLQTGWGRAAAAAAPVGVRLVQHHVNALISSTTLTTAGSRADTNRLGYDSCSTMSMGSSVTMLADMAPYLSTCASKRQKACQQGRSDGLQAGWTNLVPDGALLANGDPAPARQCACMLGGPRGALWLASAKPRGNANKTQLAET